MFVLETLLLNLLLITEFNNPCFVGRDMLLLI